MWDDPARLPEMAGLVGLTELHMVGRVTLPPDLWSLPSLQHLHFKATEVEHECRDETEEGTAIWWTYEDDPWPNHSSATLADMVALTAVSVMRGTALPGVALLATAPSLAEVRVDAAPPPDWTAQLARLCPDVKLVVVPSSAG